MYLLETVILSIVLLIGSLYFLKYNNLGFSIGLPLSALPVFLSLLTFTEYKQFATIGIGFSIIFSSCMAMIRLVDAPAFKNLQDDSLCDWYIFYTMLQPILFYMVLTVENAVFLKYMYQIVIICVQICMECIMNCFFKTFPCLKQEMVYVFVIYMMATVHVKFENVWLVLYSFVSFLQCVRINKRIITW